MMTSKCIRLFTTYLSACSRWVPLKFVNETNCVRSVLAEMTIVICTNCCLEIGVKINGILNLVVVCVLCFFLVIFFQLFSPAVAITINFFLLTTPQTDWHLNWCCSMRETTFAFIFETQANLPFYAVVWNVVKSSCLVLWWKVSVYVLFLAVYLDSEY